MQRTATMQMETLSPYLNPQQLETTPMMQTIGSLPYTSEAIFTHLSTMRWDTCMPRRLTVIEVNT